MNKKLHTKWGTAIISKWGYYYIGSIKEGNQGKRLHRLIWEDFYGCKIPEGYIIHHKDGNKLNNCILNLQLMRHSEHQSMHNVGENNPNYGKERPLETRIKQSVSHNNETGILRVVKRNCPDCNQGFRYQYQYYANGKQKRITSVNLDRLKQKVLAKGLEWVVIDEVRIA